METKRSALPVMNSKTKSALCLPFLTVSHPKLYFESTYAYTMGEVICQLLMLLGQAVLEVGCYLTAKLLVPFLTFGKVEQPIRNEIRYYGANAGSIWRLLPTYPALGCWRPSFQNRPLSQ